MERRLWDCHKKFEIVSFVMISKFFSGENFELVHAEPALKDFFFWELDQK
jgi:hypothetical protein